MIPKAISRIDKYFVALLQKLGVEVAEVEDTTSDDEEENTEEEEDTTETDVEESV